MLQKLCIECHWEFNKSKREGARMMQQKTQNNPAYNTWVWVPLQSATRPRNCFKACLEYKRRQGKNLRRISLLEVGTHPHLIVIFMDLIHLVFYFPSRIKLRFRLQIRLSRWGSMLYYGSITSIHFFLNFLMILTKF